MHTNHRRKNKHRANNNQRNWMRIVFLKKLKIAASQKRRSQERSLMDKRRYDDLMNHVPKNIIYDYW